MTKTELKEQHDLFLEKLREEARAQAKEEFKEIERKSLLASMLDEERAKLRPPEPEVAPEEMVNVTIDVPAISTINQANESGITINGKSYIYGETYQVSRSLAADLNHLMWRANLNERVIGSAEANRRKIIDARVGQVMIDPRIA
jgi:hypothetical protein